MQISEVRIKLVEKANDRLKAFCSVTFDDSFVIRDLKIIEGANGLFVAMPSRKLTDHCPTCRTKNHYRARFCNECGKRLEESRLDIRGRRIKLHADIAHPINSECRQSIQKTISEAYYDELEKSKQPDYVPPSLDYDDEGYSSSGNEHAPATPAEPGTTTEPYKAPSDDSESELEPQEPDETEKPGPESEKPGESDFSDGIL